MSMTIISLAILFAHFRRKLGGSSLELRVLSDLLECIYPQTHKKTLMKQDPSQLIKSGCHV